MPASRKREFPAPEPRGRRMLRDARGRFVGVDDLVEDDVLDLRDTQEREVEPGADEYGQRMLH